jgi:hypothetical protein
MASNMTLLTTQTGDTPMQVTFLKDEHRGQIAKYRKENKLQRQYTVVARGADGFREPLILRVYHTAASAFACLWVSHSPRGETSVSLSGGGKAGGYGYHKASAAAQAAFDDAGVKLSEDIAGCGDSAMRDALAATAQALGYSDFTIVEAFA